MGLSYKKLWKLLIDRDITKNDLCKKTGIGRSTLNKLKNGENINTAIIERICRALKCRVEDIVEYFEDDNSAK